MMKSTSLYFN